MNHHLGRRLFVLVFMFSLLVVPLATARTARAGDSETTFTAAAVKISQSGQFIGSFSFPEAPGYGPAGCDAHSFNASVHLSPSGYISVLGDSVHGSETVTTTQVLYQKLADGSYSYVATGANVDVIANINYPVYVPLASAFDVPIGPDYVLAYQIDWHAGIGGGIEGTVVVGYTLYHRTLDGTGLSNSSVCGHLEPTYVGVNTSTGTVNSILSSTIGFYPVNTTVPITWDGKTIGSVLTGFAPFATGSVQVPASPMGPHIVHWKYGHWDSKITYTVKPRIKVTPSSYVSRGSTVNVSLRGYAAHETVNIRWIKYGSYVHLAYVTTSSTGSANINVKVPTWVPNGSTSVRGDGTYGHAQTNAVTVNGGPFNASTIKTPTPTPTATASPTATSTETPATPEATETASPVAETPIAGETATPEPSPSITAEPTDTPAPTDEASSPTPTDTPTIEPTAVPSETAEATATNDAG